MENKFFEIVESLPKFLTIKKQMSVIFNTQSPSGSAPGTNTLISLDFAVVMDASKESLLRYSWQPEVLSTEIVGAAPCD